MARGVAGERIDEQEEILAYHLEQAVELRRQLGPLGEREMHIGRRAALHLRDAGQRASERGDLAAAMNLYGRAAELLAEGDEARPDLLLRFGDTMIPTVRHRESVGVLEHARDAAIVAVRPTNRVARTDHALERAHAGRSARGEHCAVPRRASRGDRVFESLGDERAQARAWMELAQTEWMHCRYGAAIPLLARARELADRSGALTFNLATSFTAGAMFHGPTPAQEALDAIAGILADARLTPLARAGSRGSEGGVTRCSASSTGRKRPTMSQSGSSEISGSHSGNPPPSNAGATRRECTGTRQAPRPPTGRCTRS